MLSVHAYAIASTVAPRNLDSLFPAELERVKVAKTHVVVRFSEARWAVAHDFGALVFVDVPDADRQRTLDRLVGKVTSESRPPLAETFSIDLKPGVAPSVHFDRVVLDVLDARTVEVLSLVIAQSTGMEYYENDVDELVGEIERISIRLADQGRFRARSRELLSFVGRGMAMRTRVIHTLALLDAPAITWEDERLDRLHHDLQTSFAIEDRYRALDHKLRMIQDNLELLVDLTRHSRSITLEFAVFLLIAIELALVVAGHR
jgi:uncharacterized Rmd1/YagE family protein